MHMFKNTRQVVGALAVAAMVGTGAAATAAQTTTGDGLITVAVGDITITDAVDIGVAAQIGANICGLKVGPVAVLGRSVDRSGDDRTVCTTDQGDLVVLQNN